MNEKYNPFKDQENDLEINSDKELEEAKEIAGVVNEDEHIERMLISGDEKLIKTAMDRIKSELTNKNMELVVKSNEIEKLKMKMQALEEDKFKLDKVREMLKDNKEVDLAELEKQAHEKIKKVLETGEDISIESISRDKFENEYGSKGKKIAGGMHFIDKVSDIFKGLHVAPNVGEEREYHEAEIKYADQILNAIENGKKFVNVEGGIHIIEAEQN